MGTTFAGRKRLWLLDEIFESEIKPAFPDAELWLVTKQNVTRDGVRCFADVTESELIELYQRAWVFCLPSTYEGFGVPYIEAMACGTPVLATPNVGADWVLGGGRFGAIACTSELGRALRELLGSRKRRDLLGDAGLVRAQQFSLAGVTAQYLALYARLIRENSGSRADDASQAGKAETPA